MHRVAKVVAPESVRRPPDRATLGRNQLPGWHGELRRAVANSARRARSLRQSRRDPCSSAAAGSPAPNVQYGSQARDPPICTVLEWSRRGTPSITVELVISREREGVSRLGRLPVIPAGDKEGQIGSDLTERSGTIGTRGFSVPADTERAELCSTSGPPVYTPLPTACVDSQSGAPALPRRSAGSPEVLRNAKHDRA